MGEPGILSRYKQAEKFLMDNAEHLVSKTNTRYVWSLDEAYMIYKHDLYDQEKEYVLVNLNERQQGVVFDHQVVLKALNVHLTNKMSVLDLHILDLVDNQYLIALQEGKRFRITFDNQVDYLEDFTESESSDKGRSPDDKWLIYVEDHNLFLKEVASKKVTQLTWDGQEGFAYGNKLPDPREMLKVESESYKEELSGYWSPDSKFFITEKIDYRDCSHSPFTQSCPKDMGRPRVYNPVKALVGDERVPVGYVTIVHVDQATCQILDQDPVEITSWGGGIGLSPSFDEAYENFYFLHVGRGSLFHTLKKINLSTGLVKVILNKQSDRKLFENFYHLDLKNEKIIDLCDRDGWPHLYINDLDSGCLLGQVTQGDFGVRRVDHVDEDQEIIYFSAYGREGSNPYHERLYRIRYDGTDLRCLTPEDQYHQVEFSRHHTYFIDTYSSVREAETFVVRRTITGEKLMDLKTLDISRLLDSGWTPVEEFVAKARDGKTDIYCNVHRPSNFDPSRKYPIIENIYASPWGYFAAKCFNGNRYSYSAYTGFLNQSLAELGFIVVMIDGFGTYGRGNAFADKGVYRQVRESGLPDHVAALKQLADQYDYIDLDRVGIFGSSAGGYDTVNAMLTYPEVYKVGVACAGSHDYRIDPAKIHEEDSGYPAGDFIDKQANVQRAHRLEGKLLLGHGETDPNVNVAQTLRLAKALIDHNKDFDMLILPNVDHGILRNKYFQRRLWDYFVRNLLDEQPPKNYVIQ